MYFTAKYPSIAVVCVHNESNTLSFAKKILPKWQNKHQIACRVKNNYRVTSHIQTLH